MTPRRLLAAVGAAALIALAIADPRAALAGWRALFVTVCAAPPGAVVLLCIARLTGADWTAALLPIARAMPWLLVAGAPLVIEQAVFVALPPHLALWLSAPAFAVRGAFAIALWWWLARRAAGGTLTTTIAGAGLTAHAVLAPLIASDWLLGTAPAQPLSAAPFILAVSQILAACGMTCAASLGAISTRRDLAQLGFAAALGLAYLLFVDFLIVWFGNLPARVGFYIVRTRLPWAAVAIAALLVGLGGTIAALVLRRERAAGSTALAGLALAGAWLVAPAGGALALLAGGAGLLVAIGIVP